DDDLLSQRLRHAADDQPRGGVRRSARREWRDQRDHAARIVVGARRSGDEQECNGGKENALHRSKSLAIGLRSLPCASRISKAAPITAGASQSCYDENGRRREPCRENQSTALRASAGAVDPLLGGGRRSEIHAAPRAVAGGPQYDR